MFIHANTKIAYTTKVSIDYKNQMETNNLFHTRQRLEKDSSVSHSWIQTVGLWTDADPEESGTALSVACYQ